MSDKRSKAYKDKREVQIGRRVKELMQMTDEEIIELLKGKNNDRNNSSNRRR